MDRRNFLQAAMALSAYGLPVPAFMAAAEAAATGPAEAFDYAWLKGRARFLASKSYEQGTHTLPKAISDLTYDQYQSIQFLPDHALWYGEKLNFELRFFHMGLFFNRPVRLFEIADGKSRELLYDPSRFNFGKSGVNGKKLPKTLGYAGFRIQHPSNKDGDVAAFLGASYFRAVGEEAQYGLSARGLAVDTGLPRDEEFPMFTHYWFEKPKGPSETMVVYGLLDSPSIAGAYRFSLKPGKRFEMEIDAALYPRKEIERLGIAPLTSMYQTGENDRRMAYDFRPEIHDTDGLAMHTGGGEWIWRPLANPTTLRFNSYFDNNPRGFGLLQRDRNFDHYQDDGVFYEKRPSLWVEPKGDWGKGAVQLVEIPTVDETFDNIVAFWNPEKKTQAGEEMLLGYRLYWGGVPPATPPLATVKATHTGLGGVVGHKKSVYSWRFAIDFSGGELAGLAQRFKKGEKIEIKPVITNSRGRIEIPSARPLYEIDGYRAMFDLYFDETVEPINLRLYLALDGKPLTETWLYQYTPPAMADRKLP